MRHNSLTRNIFAGLLFILLVLSATEGFAATLYMGNSGTDSGSCQASDCKTMQYALSRMSANDILVIRDGTYTGASNEITGAGLVPPNGTGNGGDPNSGYTVIEAEHDGQVTFDGQGSNCMFDIEGGGTHASPAYQYWQFGGIKWGNSTLGTRDTKQAPEVPANQSLWSQGKPAVLAFGLSHVKFIRCGAFNSGYGNNPIWDVEYSQYVLQEECYAWGSGKSAFMLFFCDHCICRRCVGRLDFADTFDEPFEPFISYDSQYVLFQNCINIDTNLYEYWWNISYFAGSFNEHTMLTDTSGYFGGNVNKYTTFTTVEGSMAINTAIGFLTTAQDASNNKYINDISAGTSAGIYGNTGANYTFDHLTLVNYAAPLCNSTVTPYTSFGPYAPNVALGIDSWSSNYGVTNTIITGLDKGICGALSGDGNALMNLTSSNYNVLYGNTGGNYYAATPGANDITTVNPFTASLLYPVRIESSSPLSNAGSSGNSVGAAVLYEYGVSGTLFGDTGYDTLTSTPLWPFPYEDQIQTDFRSYNCGGGDPAKPDGCRGFAANGNGLYGGPITLTSYIWEYLGNAMPLMYAPGSSGAGGSNSACSVANDVEPIFAFSPISNIGYPLTNTTMYAQCFTLGATTDITAYVYRLFNVNNQGSVVVSLYNNSSGPTTEIEGTAVTVNATSITPIGQRENIGFVLGTPYNLNAGNYCLVAKGVSGFSGYIYGYSRNVAPDQSMYSSTTSGRTWIKYDAGNADLMGGINGCQ